MIYLFTSDDVQEVSKLFNVHCTYWAMLFKSLNFVYKLKKIIALKRSLHELIRSSKCDENSEDFVKNVRFGYICYRTFLSFGWSK